MKYKKFSIALATVCFVFLWLCYSLFAQDQFRIGSWCLTGSSDINTLIQFTTKWELISTEQTLLENLGLNYIIACTRAYTPNHTHGEEALNNYGISRSGAFQSTLEVSPANTESGVAYQIWKAIEWPTGGPDNANWRAYVDSGFASMDMLHSDKTGVHSFLAGAESNLDTRVDWLDYICNSIHTHASGVPALVQAGYYEPPTYDNPTVLDYILSNAPDMDIFQVCRYVFRDTTPSSGARFQDALQNNVIPDASCPE